MAERASAKFSTIMESLPDRCAQLALYFVAFLVSASFAWILFDLMRGGAEHLSISFLIDTPRDAGRAGGISSILISTTLILLIALAVALPLGWATAALLAEYLPISSHFGHAVRYSLLVLAAVPSIIFGLFGNAFFSIYLGMGSLFYQVA